MFSFLPDHHGSLLGVAGLQTDVDPDPTAVPGHGGDLLGGDEAGEQELARHYVGLHHLGVHVVLAHHLQIRQ